MENEKCSDLRIFACEKRDPYMNTYLLIFVIALVSSLLFTPLVRRVCERFGWFDEPKDLRRVHRAAIPRLGGVVIFLSLTTALIAVFLARIAFVDNQVTQSLMAEMPSLLVALVPAVLVFAIGVIDDLRELPPLLKLAVQIMAAGLFYALGGRIESLSVPVLGHVHLPVAIGITLTVIWVVAITNAFNLIDGIDGLAAGAALFASCVMIVVSFVSSHFFVTVIALALAGSLIGFLRYNFHPASIFLGDSGSLLLGFLLATLSVQGIQKASMAVAVAIPLLAFAVPVLDTGLALTRRFLSKRPLFQGDREHIHHKLLARGWSQRRVALVLYAVCALLGLQAMLFTQVGTVGRITGLWLFIVGVGIIFLVDRLHYHEIDEIRAGLRRSLSLTERRVRLANSIRIRRANAALAKATSLQELFAAVRDMLELSGFVCATAQLDRHAGPHAAANNRCVLMREREAQTMDDIEISSGSIYWVWERAEAKVANVVNSTNFRSLRLSLSTPRITLGYINLYRRADDDLPLFDLNAMCGFFQNEMSAAVERLFALSEANAEAEEFTFRFEVEPEPITVTWTPDPRFPELTGRYPKGVPNQSKMPGRRNS
jgi:UDP-GlcNAc:undecaprenyl-phosphate GlcNAc-1-phosphate transferase